MKAIQLQLTISQGPVTVWPHEIVWPLVAGRLAHDPSLGLVEATRLVIEQLNAELQKEAWRDERGNLRWLVVHPNGVVLQGG